MGKEEDCKADSAANAASQEAAQEVRSESQGKEASIRTWIYFVGFLFLMGLSVAFLGSDSREAAAAAAGPLAMPALLREHFASGRFIKVELGAPKPRSVKVFVKTSQNQGEFVLLLHGMGSSSFLYRKIMPLLQQSGLNAVALDFPGSGFSEKFTLEEWKVERSGISWLVSRAGQILQEIMERGPFWRLEQLFETGNLPEVASDEAVEIVKWPVGGDSEELGEALGQVLDSIGADKVHVVAHDTGSEAARIWTLRNPSRVLSVTIVDSSPWKPALPVLLLGSPGIGSLFLSSTLLFSRLLKSCCLGRSSFSSEEAEAHAFLLRDGRGREALLEMARMLNSSASLSLWEELREDVPIQVLWSGGFSEEWKDEGERVLDLLPRAALVLHSGSKWPQEDAAEEIANAIQKLVLSLPPSRIKQDLTESEGVLRTDEEHSHHHHHHHSEEHTHDHHHHHHHSEEHTHDHHHFGYEAWGL